MLGQPTFTIIDGVRRAKAADIAFLRGRGPGLIRAEVVWRGRVAATVELAAGSLLSPKPVIDTSGAGLRRWLHTLRQTLAGSEPPIIQVERGASGTPIRDVTVL